MPASTATFTSSEEVLTGFNIAFSTNGQKWVTRYSYITEGMERLKNKFFSFKDGSIFIHDKGTNNTFYGVAAPSIVKVVSNFNPSLVKTFDAISIEGNDAWTASFENTDQSSSLATTDYAEKERSYYADIPRDINTSITANTTNITTLGKDATSSTNVITFPNRINRQPIPTGLSARVYKVDSSGNATNPTTAVGSPPSSPDAYVSAVTSTTISLQDASGNPINASIASSDIIIVQTTPKFDGDQLRDHYLVIEMQNTNYSKDVEMYAVNIKYKRSKLDDSLGNQAEIQ
jgi:hypothetical protein